MGTRVQGSFSDHVVGVCRGERVSWRCVVGTPVGCRGDLPCRGGVSWRMSGLGPCRGGVSWRTGVVEVCRGHRLRVSWGRGYKVRFRTMSWRHVVGTRVQVTISDHVVGVPVFGLCKCAIPSNSETHYLQTADTRQNMFPQNIIEDLSF